MSTTQPKPVQLLLLSDIHFGNLASSPDFAPRGDPPKHAMTRVVPMRDSLVKSLSGRLFDGLLVSGDMTASGGPIEFKECWDVLSGMASELKIGHDKISPVFGNHDVDWAISRLSEGVAGRQPDEMYRRVASSVGAQFIEVMGRSCSGPLPGTGVYEYDDYIIYAANTGFYCCHDQKYPHGRLGVEQLNWLRDVLAPGTCRTKWRILLMHHHPFNYTYPTPAEDISCVQEGAELVELIGVCGVDIVCHGHRHHPLLFTDMRSGWLHPVTFLCAGSLAVGSQDRRAGEIPNLFHVIKLETKHQNHGAMGCVESFRYTSPQGWMPVEYSSLVPLDAEMRFGGVSTDNERSESARRLIREETEKHPASPIVDLSAINNLPNPLQCMPWGKLNQVLQSEMAGFPQYRLLGKYPADVFLRKV